MKAVVSTQWGLPVRTRTLKTTTISFTNHKCHCWIAGSCLVVKLYCHCQCLQPILFLNYARSVTQINQVLKTGFCYLVFIYMLINNISICLKKKKRKKDTLSLHVKLFFSRRGAENARGGEVTWPPLPGQLGSSLCASAKQKDAVLQRPHRNASYQQLDELHLW